MIIGPKKYLPLSFGEVLTLLPLTWSDFKGSVQKNSQFIAHTFWSIEYSYSFNQRLNLSIKLVIEDKSWVKDSHKEQDLLLHEQGHYLIGGLCALQFCLRAHNSIKYQNQTIGTTIHDIFNSTLKQFQSIEVNYDKQTQHRLNKVNQRRWNQFIYDRLMVYKQIFK